METWQRSHITSNLTNLARTTRCTVSLKAWLQQHELIASEEDEILTSIGEDKGPTAESKELYTILSTRVNGYETFMECLQAHRQTDAWRILQEGYRGRENVSTSVVGQLLATNIEISGTSIPLKEKFPDFTYDDALDILVQPAIYKELASIIKNTSSIKLDGIIPQPRPLYIPRSISNRLVLDPSVFRMNCKDVFVFKGISRNDLDILVAPFICRRSSTQCSDISSRHIYLEDEDDWDDMAEICSDPMHLIFREDESFVLQRSTKVTTVVLENRSNERKIMDAYIQDHEFVQLLLSQLPSEGKGALVCDLPGTGKTWLMEYLARETSIRGPCGNVAVLFLQLSSFSKGLGELMSVPDTDKIVPYVLEAACQSKLSACLLQKYTNPNTLKLMVFFDGFDEIVEGLKERTVSFLKQLILFDYIRVVISSRPNRRTYLEETFNIVSYDILPFSRREQVNAVSEPWYEKFPTSDKIKLSDFAVQCVFSVVRIQKDDSRDILGVPLKCKILSVVNEKFAKRICAQTRKKPYDVVEVATLKSVLDLYATFVDTCMEKFTYLEHFRLEDILKFHVYKALQLLFQEFAPEYIKANQIKLEAYDPILNEIVKLGILCPNSEQELEFVHRSFAEYFAGKFFADFWTSIDLYAHDYAIGGVAYFIDDVMKYDVKEIESRKRQLYFEQIDSLGMPEKKKLVEFVSSTVLWFMDNIARTLWDPRGQEKPLQKFGMLSQTAYGELNDVAFNSIMDSLRETTYDTILGCIEEGFVNILSLLVDLVKAVFPSPEIFDLMVLQYEWILPRTIEVSLTLLLNTVAENDSTEAAYQIFKLFDTPQSVLVRFCQSISSEFYSPLEVAIACNAIDMVDFFFDKMPISMERLQIRCLMGNKMTDPNMNRRAGIFEKLMSAETALKASINIATFKDYLESLSAYENTNLKLLRSFAVEHNISLYQLPRVFKSFILREAIQQDDDVNACAVMILLFCERDDKTKSALGSRKNTNEANTGSVTRTLHTGFRAEQVLRRLNASEAAKSFDILQLDTNFSFKNIHKLDFLKIILHVCPDISKTNRLGWNYLHFFARLGKVEWMEHLIEAGHDIHQRDRFGETPLLCISWERTLQVTRLLVDKGADVYAVGYSKENVAHRLLWYCQNFNQKFPYDWLSYTLDKGFGLLWCMKDDTGVTPFEELSQILTSNHPAAVSLKQFINSKPLALVDRRIRLKLAIYDANDDQLLELLLNEFPKTYEVNPEDNSNSCLPTSHISIKEVEMENFEAVFCLERLDLVALKEAFSNLCLKHSNRAFVKIRRLETLKVLTGICADFTQCNEFRMNYLHYAAMNGQLDWLQYLCSSGHDVNQMAKFGVTPLQFINSKNPVDVTRILIENGACVYNTNVKKQNVAHTLALERKVTMQDIPGDWVTYTLENGYDKLWDMTDIDRKIPFEYLIDGDRSNNPKSAKLLDTMVLFYLFNLDFRNYIKRFSRHTKLCFDTLERVVFTQKLNLSHIAPNYKLALMRCAIYKGTDIQIIQLLILFFPSYDYKSPCSTSYCVNEQVEQENYFNASKVLKMICLPDVKKVFLLLDLNDVLWAFKNAIQLETMKVLVGICPDFTLCNQSKTNYLHVAAHLGRVDWMEYLIKNGFDVNEQDIDGDRPLHCISCMRPVEVTRLLIAHGADVYATDKWGYNVAHKFLDCVWHETLEDVANWTNYMLEHQFDALWGVREKLIYPPRTPFEMLLALLGRNHPHSRQVFVRLPFQAVILENDTLNEEPCLTRLALGKQPSYLQQRLESLSDDRFISELKSLFSRCTNANRVDSQAQCADFQSPSVSATNTTPYIFANDILDRLDLVAIKEAFSKVQFGNGFFKNLHNLETLKVLVNVCPDFSQHNPQGSNYLHFAVYDGKVDWVEHLLKIGQDVNQRDSQGNTPLLCISMENTVEITRLLVENKANVYAVDALGENLLKKVRWRYGAGYQREPVEWVTYLVSKGYNKLFESF